MIPTVVRTTLSIVPLDCGEVDPSDVCVQPAHQGAVCTSAAC